MHGIYLLSFAINKASKLWLEEKSEFYNVLQRTSNIDYSSQGFWCSYNIIMFWFWRLKIMKGITTIIFVNFTVKMYKQKVSHHN